MASIKIALLRAAVQGKKIHPNQLLQARYGQLGGLSGRLQGLHGLVASNIPQPPQAPSFPSARAITRSLVKWRQ
jgi:hypothetical protein